jgi:hypothetical protein
MDRVERCFDDGGWHRGAAIAMVMRFFFGGRGAAASAFLEC